MHEFASNSSRYAEIHPMKLGKPIE
jgi:hypothetical protein